MSAIPAALHRDALRGLRVLDTLPEQVFGDIVLLASRICGTPVSLVSLVDRDRQWFKARVGLAAPETHRDLAFCSHAIVSHDPLFVVEDTAMDPRFSGNPLVTGEPGIRFYAGAPIVMPDGHAMGTVCVIDTVPRTLDAAQRECLQALARQTTALFELRLRTLAAQAQQQELERVCTLATDERQRSAELLEIVLQGGDLGLWDLHVPSGRYSLSERERVILGLEPHDAHPDAVNWRSVIHPDDWPTLKAASARHFSGLDAFYECEHRMQRKDGAWIWVRAHAVVVERDAAGVPVRIVGTHKDITDRMADHHALQRATELLQRMGALAKVGGWELDLLTQKITWTEEVYRIHELDPSTELTLLPNIDFYAPPARPVIAAAVARAIRDGVPYDLELPFVTARGRALTVRTQGERLDCDGKALRLFGTFQDITAQKAAEQAAIDSQRRLRMVADNLPALIFHIDRHQRYLFANAYSGQVLGMDPSEIVGRTIREVRGEAMHAQIAPHVEAVLRGEPTSFANTASVNGRTYHYQSNYIPDVNEAGAVEGFFVMIFDITELHETQSQLERLARVDALTGLPNRRQFEERLAEAISRTRRTGQAMAVMFLDIDHFKAVNDSFGHAAGDAVLCEFAHRLKLCLRATDTVARLAGDEFVILLEGSVDVAELGRLAGRVVACIRPPMSIGPVVLDVTTSVGVAHCEGGAQADLDLMSMADEALYRAKKQGRNRFVLAGPASN